MKYRNEKLKDRPERPKSGKEKKLLDILLGWGFYQAAANLDVLRDRIDIDHAIASWSNYPKCMDGYPTIITKKTKLDLKELPI